MYTEMAAQAGMAGVYLAVANAGGMPPWGGTSPVLGPNPLSIAIPAAPGRSFVLDIATTAASHGAIKVARQRGEPMPVGWVADRHGRPITDPDRAEEGFLLPIGGHKGSGLTIAIGLLAGVLNGAAFGGDVVDHRADLVTPTNTGQLLIALRADVFRPLEPVLADVVRHLDDLREPACGDPLRLPGDEAARLRAENTRLGVPIAPAVISALNAEAARHGISQRLQENFPTPPRKRRTMKLVTFETGPRTGIGALLENGDVVDFAADPGLPATMAEFVAMGAAGLGRAVALVASSAALPASGVTLLAPIRPPSNVMCVGKNYLDHASEFAGSGFDASQRQVVPDHPVVFTKARSSIVGPGQDVEVSADATGTTDYEGELAVVIGEGGVRIPAEQAWRHVYGYTIVNDLTVRELQKRHVQFFIGKSAATYCPIGPCLVTRDELGDLAGVSVRTRVNGELRQQAPLTDLIFPIPVLIEAISAAVALEPGDVIATGTPAGVGIGFDPPRYLAPGDLVEISVDGIGTLANRAV
ncbi:Ldh family oxidoreductase [Nonomuraea purpurea]|uniref:Ldh family oxidoreductase n=1 Tax=Nonomuraea purpurea TaxID=1849276 RepID=A0ABV8G649_9ACTN